MLVVDVPPLIEEVAGDAHHQVQPPQLRVVRALHLPHVRTRHVNNRRSAAQRTVTMMGHSTRPSRPGEMRSGGATGGKREGSAGQEELSHGSNEHDAPEHGATAPQNTELSAYANAPADPNTHEEPGGGGGGSRRVNGHAQTEQHASYV